MSLIGTAVSCLANVLGIHGWFSGLRTGREVRQTLDHVERMHAHVEHISDRISVVSQLEMARPAHDQSLARVHAKDIYDLFAPLQRSLDEDLLVGAVFEAPGQLRKALEEDPWKVLIEVRPLIRATRPTNPDLVPVLFHDNGVQYVGWQMRGILPSLFGVEFSEEVRLRPLSDSGVRLESGVSGLRQNPQRPERWMVNKSDENVATFRSKEGVLRSCRNDHLVWITRGESWAQCGICRESVSR